jgi:hypothetical protein
MISSPTSARRLTLAGLAFCVALGACAATSIAADKPAEAIAAAVPVEIAEVVSSGAWQDEGVPGIYRVVTVLSGSGNDYAANVVIQWLALKPGADKPQVLKSVAIHEVAERHVPSVSLSLEADKENEALILIRAPDPVAKQDIVLAFLAGRPGVYKPTTAPATGAPPKR